MAWYMAEREVRSICIAQLHPSISRGVYGVWTIGESLYSEGGFDELPCHCRKWLCRYITVFGIGLPSPS